MLTIEPKNAADRSRILRALSAEPSRRSRFRCKRGCALAEVWATAEGIVFKAQPWEVPQPLGLAAFKDGRRLTRRATIVLHEGDDGTRLDMLEQHATLALLADDAEAVDLLVCCKHGSAVIDRAEAIVSLRDESTVKVPTTMPRKEYAQPTAWGVDVESVTSSRTIGAPMPWDDAVAWLATRR